MSLAQAAEPRITRWLTDDSAVSSANCVALNAGEHTPMSAATNAAVAIAVSLLDEDQHL